MKKIISRYNIFPVDLFRIQATKKLLLRPFKPGSYDFKFAIDNKIVKIILIFSILLH
jgi:hypothetical protein